MKTTLNEIRKYQPCTSGWQKLLAYLGKTKADDEPLEITTILDSNGVDNALWCLRAVEGKDREVRLFAVWCARQVQHVMTDQRSLDALDVAERYANGQATEKELNAARSAAWRAVGTARDVVAWAAASAAAWAAAWYADRAANAAAEAPAMTARAAADVADVADAAWAATGGYAAKAAAAWDVAWEAARAKQEAELRRICEEG